MVHIGGRKQLSMKGGGTIVSVGGGGHFPCQGAIVHVGGSMSVSGAHCPCQGVIGSQGVIVRVGEPLSMSGVIGVQAATVRVEGLRGANVHIRAIVHALEGVSCPCNGKTKFSMHWKRQVFQGLEKASFPEVGKG